MDKENRLQLPVLSRSFFSARTGVASAPVVSAGSITTEVLASAYLDDLADAQGFLRKNASHIPLASFRAHFLTSILLAAFLEGSPVPALNLSSEEYACKIESKNTELQLESKIDSAIVEQLTRQINNFVKTHIIVLADEAVVSSLYSLSTLSPGFTLILSNALLCHKKFLQKLAQGCARLKELNPDLCELLEFQGGMRKTMLGVIKDSIKKQLALLKRECPHRLEIEVDAPLSVTARYTTLILNIVLYVENFLAKLDLHRFNLAKTPEIEGYFTEVLSTGFDKALLEFQKLTGLTTTSAAITFFKAALSLQHDDLLAQIKRDKKRTTIGLARVAGEFMLAPAVGTGAGAGSAVPVRPEGSAPTKPFSHHRRLSA